MSFQKLQLASEYFCDGIDAGDINSDGKTDVVAGPFWYAGPDFQQAHEFYEPKPLPPELSPSNSMFSFVHDFDLDSRPDILVLGRVHKHAAYWYENPGDRPGLWPKHYAFQRVRGESPPLSDLFANGRVQLICHWHGRWGWIENHPSVPRRPWRFVPVGDDEGWPQFYHGQGVGDIDGDGRADIVINDGWYRQPGDPSAAWPFRRYRFSHDRGGAQMFVYDVDGDGRNDVISSINAHGWGLSWFRQIEQSGQIEFREQRIMGSREEIGTFGVAFSQPHALALADIDGDGLKDIVCGKRRWAHGPKGDIEPGAAPVVYWFRLMRRPGALPAFVPHLIDDNSGVGVQITVKDVNGDQRPDVLSASKLGTFVFVNQKSSDK